MDGSSPRMRGKREDYGIALAASGLIPAHAGKTSVTLRLLPRSEAHPRACGENWGRVVGDVNLVGSSPRMRGKRVPATRPRNANGLIPAHAGKTMTKLNPLSVRWAHPRACGENAVRAARALKVGGSSPRMRGKHNKAFRFCGNRGLIPAHAGKTLRAASANKYSPAHPRACGENNGYFSLLWCGLGSSPRMRGKRHGDPLLARTLGLIPAHAGKTCIAFAGIVVT